MKRIIMHYDMDCFYASIEIRDNPKYKNLPLVVGGGVVTTASYKARKYGIHSAMNVFEAKKLCPHLLVVPVDKDKYIKVSQKIQSLVLKITEKVEFIALDEGYVDITEVIKKFPSLKSFAEKFKERIKYHTGLTCSVGIGINKLSAKIASGINKPGGDYIFSSQQEFMEYLRDKDVKIIQGVGNKFKELLNKDKIHKVEDLYKYTLMELIGKYGKSRGELLYLSCRGIDHEEIDYQRAIHSIGNENTYRYSLDSEGNIKKELEQIFDYSYNRLIKEGLIAKTVILKIKFSNGELITRSKSFTIPTDSRQILFESLEDLYDGVEKEFGVRLLGISFGNLTKKSIRQLSFF
ncbi:DNA polymerase IV [Fusobacterium necrogenes]|uniref:DNA polymerase IV n=1 Tax=Fusobacterium necrogenes TaxID=858 RepID=A0A377GXI0_9FUSO|nr:DNA polymerase IV [Fusobacterium necrogenes]STO31563.1 DNA polymerase IV [Fusobacterium necrogenes]